MLDTRLSTLALSTSLVHSPAFVFAIEDENIESIGCTIGSYSEISNSLYIDPASHSNGTEADTFAITSAVTLLNGNHETGAHTPYKSRFR